MPTRRFVVIAALLFAAAASLTLVSSHSMTTLPMPGGWSMSTMWTRDCGKTWLRAAADFIAMWLAMMTAMMLPSFAPLLRGRSIKRGAAMSLGYMSVWGVTGVGVYVTGVGLAELLLRVPVLARAMPVAGACVVMMAGVLQLSRWKARRLACCRIDGTRVDALRLGVQCVSCCAPLTAVLCVLGVMDFRAMALVTAAITIERRVPGMQRLIGGLMMAVGVGLMVVR